MFSRRRTVSNRWSIRIQLLSLTLAVMMPLVALLVLTKFGDAADEVQNAGHSALNLAEVAASSTEQFLQDSKALLTLLAPRARRYVVDSVTCDSFQHDFSNLTVQYTILEVIDRSGQPLCSTVEPVTANLQAVADRQWFQNLVRDHSFTISEPLMGRITGKWSVVLGYPLEDDDGQIVGAVSVSIDLTRYQFMLDAAALDPGSVITIIDSTGTVIACSPKTTFGIGTNARGNKIVDVVLSQAKGWTQAAGIDGVDRIYGFTTVATDNWHVYVGIPADAVVAKVRDDFLRKALLALATVGTAAALALYLGRRIERPIRALARAASDVQQGRLNARAPIEGPLEVAQVARQFNEMLDTRVQVEQALRDNESRLRLIISQLPVMLWTTDTDLRFTSNLGAGFHSVNVEPNYLVGRTLFETLNTNEPNTPAIQCHLQALEGKSGVYELTWLDRYYESHVEPLRDNDGHIVGCIGAALDVTERKKAEAALRKSEELFRAMIENSLDGIVLLAADGTIMYASPGANRISGYSTGEGIGQNRADLIHPDDLEQARIEWSKLLQQPGATSTREYRVRHKNGSWQWVERVLYNLLRDPSVKAVVSNYRDITGRKNAEEALQQYTLRLKVQHEIDEAILAAESLEEIAAAVLQRVTGLVPSQEAHISLFDFETQEVTVYAVVAASESVFVPGTRIPFENLGNINPILDRLRQGQVVVVDNVSVEMPDTPSIQDWLAGRQRAVIAGPLRVKDELIGTLSLSTDLPAHYSPEDIDIVQELSNSLAVAIAQVRLFEDVSAARDRLQILSTRLVAAQEDARRRLAQDLHDQVGTILTALGINLNVLQSELSSRAAKKVKARLTDSVKLLDEAQDRIRDVMADLRPAVLDDYGLEAALRWYAGQFSRRAGLQVVVQTATLSPRLASEVETGLFRITQEALTNIAKHAQAAHINITLEKLEAVIRLTITDDGVGFNQAEQNEPDKQRGLGLIGMGERAESLGGRLRVEAAPGKGTRVIVEVPYPSVA